MRDFSERKKKLRFSYPLNEKETIQELVALAAQVRERTGEIELSQGELEARLNELKAYLVSPTFSAEHHDYAEVRNSLTELTLIAAQLANAGVLQFLDLLREIQDHPGYGQILVVRWTFARYTYIALHGSNFVGEQAAIDAAYSEN